MDGGFYFIADTFFIPQPIHQVQVFFIGFLLVLDPLVMFMRLVDHENLLLCGYSISEIQIKYNILFQDIVWWFRVILCDTKL